MLLAECLCLPTSKCQSPNSLNVMVFGDAASEKVVKVKSCHEDGVLIRWDDGLLRRGRGTRISFSPTTRNSEKVCKPGRGSSPGTLRLAA